MNTWNFHISLLELFRFQRILYDIRCFSVTWKKPSKRTMKNGIGQMRYWMEYGWDRI
jgi:hypothetical protein